jgi:hypothetical protein
VNKSIKDRAVIRIDKSTNTINSTIGQISTKAETTAFLKRRETIDKSRMNRIVLRANDLRFDSKAEVSRKGEERSRRPGEGTKY